MQIDDTKRDGSAPVQLTYEGGCYWESMSPACWWSNNPSEYFEC